MLPNKCQINVIQFASRSCRHLHCHNVTMCFAYYHRRRLPSYANNPTNVLSIVKCPLTLFRKRRRVPFNGSNCLVKDQFANSLNWRNYVLGIPLIFYLIWISMFVTFLWFLFSRCSVAWVNLCGCLPWTLSHHNRSLQAQIYTSHR